MRPCTIKLDKHLEHRPREAPRPWNKALARTSRDEAPRPLELFGDGATQFLFHAQTRSRNLRRPRVRRSGSWRSISRRSTTICVAMPAWSVPGCHSTSAPTHALEPREHVLQRVVQRVPHVQRPRDIGRGNDNAKRLGRSALGPAATERARFLPLRINARFDFGGLVRLADHAC